MDEKNKEKTEPKTAKKQLFVKGGAPGPGRGNRKPSKPMTIEDVELALSEDLRSKDAKIRLPATRLLLQLKRQFPDQGESQILDPIIMPLIDLLSEVADIHLAATGESISMIDAIGMARKYLETCPYSPVKPGEWEEVQDDGS